MKRSIRKPGFVILLVLALLLGACGTDDTIDEGGGETAGGGGGSDTSAVDPEDAEGDPVAGGTLRYGTYLEATGFDPAQRGSYHQNTAIYDTLLRLNDEGDAEPYLAESLESEDLQTWTLTLRPDVQFHDGTTLDAEAVKFNIERHMDPANSSSVLSEVSDIESVEVVDELTVVFNLKYPVAAFPISLAGFAGMIGSPTAIEEQGEDYGQNPVGAGPFEFVEWIPDERTVLRRNENYWQEGLPYLDEIVYLPRPDTETRQDSLMTGDIDVTWHLTAKEINEAQDAGNVKVLLRQGNGAEGILLNVGQPPFDDPRMRRMMAHSLNYDVISDVRFNGEMERAYTPIGPDSPQYHDVSDMFPDYDLEAAKALIDEYVADGGDPSFTFAAPNTPDRIIFGEMVQQFWGDLGLEVQLEFLDITEYVQRVLYVSDFQAAINTMPAFPHPYPDIFNTYVTDGSNNFMQYSNPEMDEVLATARSSQDEDERLEAWARAQEIIAEDLPWVWYARNATALLTGEDVNGVHFTPDGLPYFEETWLNE